MKNWILLFCFFQLLFFKSFTQTTFFVSTHAGSNIVLKNNFESKMGSNLGVSIGMELGKKDAAIQFLPSMSITRNNYKAVLFPDVYLNIRQAGFMMQLNSSIKINNRIKFFAGLFTSFIPFASIDISQVDRNTIGYVSYDDYYNFYNPKELQVGINTGFSFQPFKTEILWIDAIYQHNVSGFLEEDYVLDRFYNQPKTLFSKEAKAAYITLGLRFLFVRS